MNLHRVCPGKYLHWPPSIDKKDPLWLAPGGLLDLEDPFTQECVKGQEYKLEPAPDAQVATSVSHGRFDQLRREFEAKRAREAAAAAPAADGAPATPEKPKDTTIPKPDHRPKKEELRHAASSGPVSQSHPR